MHAHAICTLLLVHPQLRMTVQLAVSVLCQHADHLTAFTCHTMQENVCEAFDGERPVTSTFSLFKHLIQQ